MCIGLDAERLYEQANALELAQLYDQMVPEELAVAALEVGLGSNYLLVHAVADTPLTLAWLTRATMTSLVEPFRFRVRAIAASEFGEGWKLGPEEQRVVLEKVAAGA